MKNLKQADFKVRFTEEGNQQTHLTLETGSGGKTGLPLKIMGLLNNVARNAAVHLGMNKTMINSSEVCTVQRLLLIARLVIDSAER